MTQVESVPAAHVHAVELSTARRAWNFVRHAIEMCLAMCVGLMILDPIYGWLAGQVGASNPYVRFPELSAAVVAFNMTAPMVAWMRFRGMEWRLVNEMSAAMVVEAVLILAAYRAGLLPNVEAGSTSTLWQAQHGLMMPAMLVPMLLRLDHYASGMHHRQVHAV